LDAGAWRKSGIDPVRSREAERVFQGANSVMSAFEEELRRRLEALESENLRRSLRRVDSPQATRVTLNGRNVLNFSSNDYLGLATHPALRAAAEKAVRDYGTGAGASRLISGSLAPHHALEEALADFKGVERALVFATGYATAVGTISALVSTGDVVVLDKLVHASIVDGAKLSGAKLRVFDHNDLNDLVSILKWADAKGAVEGRVLIVTESLFSMDGDVAPLEKIVELKERYGAWLMVDEAHSTGLFGAKRSGIVEERGLSERVEIQMGTLGKAVGSAGGYIAGAGVLIDYLVNKARSFIFSTAPPPSVSAASLAGIKVVRSEEGKELVSRLRGNIQRFCVESEVQAAAENSPIVPFLVGAEVEALRFAGRLLEAGFFAPAIRYPTVARGQARLRFSFSAAHTGEEVSALSRALKELS
jgi:8-amino-7-oxononanoate synthase